MSIENEIRCFAKSTDATTMLSSVVQSFQSEGWTYDEITYNGYTINSVPDWAFTKSGRHPVAGSLEEGVKIVAERGSGALTLSQEIAGRVVDMIIHFSVSDLLNDHREPTTESVFRITLNVSCPRFVRNSEEALLKFLETTVRLIRDIDPLVVFAGIEHEIPNVTETELETAPIRISPCTYFGPTACDYLGRDKLLSAPAKLVKTIGDGILLVACPRYFGGCILTECDPIAEHLDLESAR